MKLPVRCPGCVTPFLIGFLLLPAAAKAQTLTDALIREAPSKLVLAARESGDIVRGAILFHQGNINCAKCHRPIAEKDRIGPDLSRLDRNAADETLVEAILQPSKTIRKGYKTSSIVTTNGRVLTGTIIRQDDTEVVLRTREKIDELTTIARADIEVIQPSERSNMPDGLVNQLKNRQQFLDLLRYVIDLKHRGPDNAGPAGRTQPRRQLATALQGLVLIDRFNCTACHDAGNRAALRLCVAAPDLRWSAAHVNPEALAKFVAAPHRVKPGSRMPDVLHRLSEEERTATAEAIVRYLISINADYDRSAAAARVQSESSRRGFELFQSVGCVACHAPRNRDGHEQPLTDSVPLGDLTLKYRIDALSRFLKDPHQSRPSGKMPNLQLQHREAVDLATFLLQKSSPASAGELVADQPQTSAHLQSFTDPEQVTVGRRLFRELKCSSCHGDPTNPVASAPRPPTTAAATAQKPLYECNLKAGCLSDASGRGPDYRLTSQQRARIRAAVTELTEPLTDQQQIDFTLVSFNCVACHSRDQLGGVAADRRVYFQTTNLNLGEQGRIPPTLTGVGAKLKRNWMRDVLVNRRTIRPYMKTRMPQYGEQNVGHLIDLFQNSDHLPPPQHATFDDQKQMRKLGLEIAGNRGLNCVACHTYQYKLSDTMPALDLTEMSQRLQKDWFYHYMLAPQKFVPNTVMPSFWPGGRAIRPDISGSPEYQIEALWQYLLDGRQAGAPRGVIREPLEIVVTNRARMLRRSYPGIGKRGIGVGYPGGVNLAFDAEQLRLASIWNGRFVDPGGVWYGQGHGRVRPLNRPVEFTRGPEFDLIDQPWVVDDGRPPQHRFRGYVLDDAGRPTFLYSFGPIRVKDRFSESKASAGAPVSLLRKIRLQLPDQLDSTASAEAGTQWQKKKYRFRIGPAGQVDNRAVATKEIRLSDGVKLRIRSDHAAVAGVETDTLHVPLQFKPGQIHKLVLEYRWPPPR